MVEINPQLRILDRICYNKAKTKHKRGQGMATGEEPHC